MVNFLCSEAVQGEAETSMEDMGAGRQDQKLFLKWKESLLNCAW